MIGILCLVLFLPACDKVDDEGTRMGYTIIGEYRLAIPEPSGLALSADRQHLWTVSDENSTVYQLSLDGKVLSSFRVEGAGDLEGIAVISDALLCVLSESSSELIFLNHHGQELRRRKLKSAGRSNSGFEGLAYDRVNDRYFVVKEKEPRVLIEFDGNLAEVAVRPLTHASDLSSLDYDHETETLWFASHESRLVASLGGGILRSRLTVPFRQIEGVAYDPRERVLYTVCDKEEKLYVLKLE
jgi:uncharacterized protein YjiK